MKNTHTVEARRGLGLLKKRRLVLTALAPVLALSLAAGAAAQTGPALTFSKAFMQPEIGPSSTSMAVFTITNISASTLATSIAFTDTLPTNVVVASPGSAVTSCVDGVVTAAGGGSTITLAGARLGAAGGTCTVTVNVTSSTVGTHTNPAVDLTSSTPTVSSAPANLVVNAYRPGFRKAFSPTSIALGGRSTLTFTIDNTNNGGVRNGGTTVYSALRFIDNLPPGVVIASPANAASTCPSPVLTAVPGAAVINFSNFTTPAVPNGGSCTVTVDVTSTAIGTLVNTSEDLQATAASTTYFVGKATAPLTVTAGSSISLVKSFTDDPVPPGGTASLQFTITNLDRNFSATNIDFTDDLTAAAIAGAGLSFAGVPTPNPPCGAGSSLSGSTTLSFMDGTLGPEASCTFTVSLAVSAMATPGLFTNTTGDITADINGDTVNGGKASDTVFIQPVPTLSKLFIGDPVTPGSTVVLRFTITNTSPTATATAIAFEDEFDSILPTASATPSGGFCGAGSTAVFTPLSNPPLSSVTPAKLAVSGANLPPGGSCMFDITLDVLAGAAAGSYTNTTGAISATVDGTTYTGNTATDMLDVISAPSLSKSFTDDPALPGGTVTLEFTLNHDAGNPNDATGIGFTDNLAAALAGLTATGLPMNDICGTGSSLTGTTSLTFAGGTLAPGASCTFSVTLTVPAGAAPGSHTNTTSTVGAAVGMTPVTGNTASDTLDVSPLTFTKEFTDDPILPGGTGTLRFTITNASAGTVTGLYFTDNLATALTGLTATLPPSPDPPCGTGSTLTGASGDTFLTLSGGNLTTGASCVFEVTVTVPGGAADGTYPNITSGLSSSIGSFPAARDDLVINGNRLQLTKSFTDDPVRPGDTATLRFTLTNLDPVNTATAIAFSDVLSPVTFVPPGGVIDGMTATGLPIAGCGGTVTGTTTISFSGGTLGAGATCFFDVTVTVPGGAAIGTFVNTTSSVTGTVSGLAAIGSPATDNLDVANVITFTKSFSGTSYPTGAVTLTFNLTNPGTSTVDGIGFTDDLSAVLSGLALTSTLPMSNVCGAGSTLSGTTLISLAGGTLPPGGNCTFSIDLQVPANA